MNKFKVGDRVTMVGIISKVDESFLPYRVEFADGRNTWFAESIIKLHESADKSDIETLLNSIKALGFTYEIKMVEGGK